MEYPDKFKHKCYENGATKVEKKMSNSSDICVSIGHSRRQTTAGRARTAFLSGCCVPLTLHGGSFMSFSYKPVECAIVPHFQKRKPRDSVQS